jgi:hypothetical protein
MHPDGKLMNHSAGFGWKIFCVYNQTLYSMLSETEYLNTGLNRALTGNDWAVWDKRHNGAGFCILPTEKEANRLLKDWRKKDKRARDCCKAIKVEYEDALSMHRETNIMDHKSYMTIIATKFRPVDGWEQQS